MIADRYTLDREIGRGGMGAVWLGHDRLLGRQVALKRIGMPPPGAGENPEAARAQREAKLAASLSDPHVVSVFDLAPDGDSQWLVMEYVEGTNLAELIKANGTLPPDQAAPILAQTADALIAAHHAGVVHRDVKPSNILVTPEGVVKLSDFGIARTVGDASLTQTGLVTGSPAYLSPEVASGRSATEASDVWSLGTTLYHALAGRPPYDVGENLLGALYRIVHEEPPRTDRAGWLAPLLEGTMARDPADRWTMAEVRDQLAAGRSGAAAVRPIARPRRPADGSASEPGPRSVPLLVLAPTPPDDDDRPSRPLLTWVLLAALLVAVLLGSTAYVLGSRGDDPADRQAQQPTSTPASPTAPTSEPTQAAAPTAADIAQFLRNYLATADADPARAFDLLTPAFQAQSGGMSGYRAFWDDVSIDGVATVAGNATDLTVSYTYSYTKGDAPRRTDAVELQLALVDGELRIDGEA